MDDEIIVQLIYKDSSTHPHFPISVSDSRLEIHRTCCTASPKPQILMPTHRVRVTLVVMGILRLATLPSGVTSNLISRMWTLLIFNLCKNHNSPLPLLMTAIAGHFSMPALWCAYEPHWPCLLWSSWEPCSEVWISPLDGVAYWDSDKCGFPQDSKGKYVPEPEFFFF